MRFLVSSAMSVRVQLRFYILYLLKRVQLCRKWIIPDMATYLAIITLQKQNDLLMPWHDKLSHDRAYYKSSRQSIAPTIDADGHGLYMVDKWYQHFPSSHDISNPRQQGHNTVLNLSMTQHVEKGHSTGQIISAVEKKENSPTDDQSRCLWHLDKREKEDENWGEVEYL